MLVANLNNRYFRDLARSGRTRTVTENAREEGMIAVPENAVLPVAANVIYFEVHRVLKEKNGEAL